MALDLSLVGVALAGTVSDGLGGNPLSAHIERTAAAISSLGANSKHLSSSVIPFF